MQYRIFGKTGLKVSTYGLGCMRLPILDDDSSKIDEPKAIEMIRFAVDSGVNYIDTAYPYHQGNSELVVGKALQGGYRERVYLATKSPSWLMNEPGDFDKYLNEQLNKLHTDHIDFYLLHGLDAERWEKLKGLGAREFLNRAKNDGRIRYAAFSFHDEFPVFKKIIDENDWDMCQIQLNFLDVHNQAGVEGLYYAARKNIPVVIMEPLRGGNLVKQIPEEVASVWKNSGYSHTPAEWAFDWLCNMPEVSVVLSGASSMEQLKNSIEIFNHALPGKMSGKELEAIDKVREIYLSRLRVGCTGCGYCQPCPAGVKIPDIFRVYNDAFMFDNIEEGKQNYARFFKDEGGASACLECGSCESACPQHLPVIEKLKEAKEKLA